MNLLLKLGDAAFTDVEVVTWDRGDLYRGEGPRGVIGNPLFADLLLTLDEGKGEVAHRARRAPARSARRQSGRAMGEGRRATLAELHSSSAARARSSARCASTTA